MSPCAFFQGLVFARCTRICLIRNSKLPLASEWVAFSVGAARIGNKHEFPDDGTWPESPSDLSEWLSSNTKALQERKQSLITEFMWDEEAHSFTTHRGGQVSRFSTAEFTPHLFLTDSHPRVTELAHQICWSVLCTSCFSHELLQKWNWVPVIYQLVMRWFHNLFLLECDWNSLWECLQLIYRRLIHICFVSSDLLPVRTRYNISFSYPDYDWRTKRTQEGRGDAGSSTNFLCEASNWFHMSWTACGRFWSN